MWFRHPRDRRPPHGRDGRRPNGARRVWLAVVGAALVLVAVAALVMVGP